mmetsp:Transcript_28072/g.62019  ORF Transcript_28072/g.62019 Transcript_28072/m.62019 type:complete len:495 (+) Transcript_28072:127-1611(+)
MTRLAIAWLLLLLQSARVSSLSLGVPGHHGGPGGGKSLRHHLANDAELQEEASITSTLGRALRRYSSPLGHWTSLVCGILTLFFSSVVHWYNERRSAKNQALVARGLADCQTVAADAPDAANRGCIVHVQGRVQSDAEVQDPQFAEVCLQSCVKLQSTVEVFEWVQSARTSQGKKPMMSTEWVMKHCDSSNFVKPAPENPHLPPDLCLGTFTTTSERVLVGQYLLPEEMVKKFRNFKPCGQQLPQQLTAAGLTFRARSDGYYHARPSQRSSRAPQGNDAEKPLVGDIRAKFIFIQDDIDATVVALQSELEGEESFMPYRAVPRCCQSHEQWKQQMIEEAERPLKDQASEAMCEGGRLASCCCCPCNFVAACTNQEILTEEIFYLAESSEKRETPFHTARQRNLFRALFFRLFGFATAFFAILLILSWWIAVSGMQVRSRFLDRTSAAVLLSGNVWFTVAAAAWASYNPYLATGWAAMDVCLIIALVVASTQPST